jgi:hypothetical protein
VLSAFVFHSIQRRSLTPDAYLTPAALLPRPVGSGPLSVALPPLLAFLLNFLPVWPFAL